jgi:hypothetical protein
MVIYVVLSMSNTINTPVVAGMKRIPAPTPLRMPWGRIRVGIVRQKPAATSAQEKMILPHIATLRKPKISTDLPTGIPIVSVKVMQMHPMEDMSCDDDC